jgi:hypothetical protein
MEVRKLGGVYRSCIGVSIFMYSHESGASKWEVKCNNSQVS